jgi:hypothetical protein
MCSMRRSSIHLWPSPTRKEDNQKKRTGSFASWLKHRKRKRSSQAEPHAADSHNTSRRHSTGDFEALYAVLPHSPSDDTNGNIEQATPESSGHDPDPAGTVSGIDVGSVDTSFITTTDRSQPNRRAANSAYDFAWTIRRASLKHWRYGAPLTIGRRQRKHPASYSRVTPW